MEIECKPRASNSFKDIDDKIQSKALQSNRNVFGFL